MIVACPNCQSKYNLPEAKIAPTGSKVRCAKCKHVFTVTPPPAQAQDFEAELAELTAAAAPRPAPAPAAPKPEPVPAPKPAPAPADKMPWDDEDFGAPTAPAPAAPRPEPAPAAKMPWDDDAPAAGPADDDDALPGSGAPRAASPFADEEPAAPAPRQDPYAGQAGAFADEEPAPVSARRDAAADEFLNSLGPGGAEPAPQPAPSGKKKILTIALVVALLAAIGGGLFVFKPWTKFNIPFLSGSSSAKKEGSDNAEKVKDIALRNVRQYYIPNEKAGNIFVVEGKAVNNFAAPKERIKVEITLFDEKGHPLAAKQLLCGNTLSQFQLQVQSEEEINASLGSEVGILTSNTYLKTGMDTPFMAVFFKPPDAVKEFGVKVIDAQDPK